MSIARHHAEWFSLVEVSGPFLSMPVLLEAFPAGLKPTTPTTTGLLRLARDEWEEKQNNQPRTTPGFASSCTRRWTSPRSSPRRTGDSADAPGRSRRASRISAARPCAERPEQRQAPAAHPDVSRIPGLDQTSADLAVEGITRYPHDRIASCYRRAAWPGHQRRTLDAGR